MLKNSPNSSSGFTLIELLVVIAIISLLASVVMASLKSARAKARDSRRVSDLKQLQVALEMYYDSNGSYPLVTAPATHYAEGRCNPPAPGWSNKANYSGADAYIPNLAPTYIPILPGDPTVDPAGWRCYVYHSEDNGQRYYIWAHRGVEGSFSANDPMIRILPPDCINAQNTFFVASGFPQCT